MALQEVARIGSTSAAPRTEEFEGVVAVTTPGNYSRYIATRCRSRTSVQSLDQKLRHNSTFAEQNSKIQAEIAISISPLALGSSGEPTLEESRQHGI